MASLRSYALNLGPVCGQRSTGKSNKRCVVWAVGLAAGSCLGSSCALKDGARLPMASGVRLSASANFME